MWQDGDVRFLVCTDVAARGLDIAGLPYCINLTLPDKPEDYIHRIGRVASPRKSLFILPVATSNESIESILIIVGRLRRPYPPNESLCFATPLTVILSIMIEEHCSRSFKTLVLEQVGRADTMGLAVSLIATEKEKVWFYDKRCVLSLTLSLSLCRARVGALSLFLLLVASESCPRTFCCCLVFGVRATCAHQLSRYVFLSLCLPLPPLLTCCLSKSLFLSGSGLTSLYRQRSQNLVKGEVQRVVVAVAIPPNAFILCHS